MKGSSFFRFILGCGLSLLGFASPGQIINPPGGPIGGNITNHEFYSLTMSGDFMVPETSSTNTGSVSLAYDYLNEYATNISEGAGGFPLVELTLVGRLYTNDTTVDWRIKLDTNFPATSGSIYGPAMPGQRGALLFDLGTPSISTNVLTVIAWPDINYSLTNFSLDYVASVTFTPEQMHQLEAGLMYVEVASTNFPAGAMRAQATKKPVLSQPRLDASGVASFKVSTIGDFYLSELGIEVSPDMQQWLPLTNMTDWETLPTITDPEASNSPNRYYRGRAVPAP